MVPVYGSASHREKRLPKRHGGMVVQQGGYIATTSYGIN